MSGSTKDEKPSATAKSPMQGTPGPKASHKRNLSNGTPDSSPVRRSKRQKSTVSLKEASSSDESEAKVAVKSTPKKAVRTKTRRASVKKEQVDETELLSSVEVGQKDSVIKSEEEGVTVETGIESAAAVQKKPAKRSKKTKEEKEAEAMPLAVRTQGLQMFVGAHVSAAKGMLLSPFVVSTKLMRVRCLQLNTQQ
jgi:AP endonuclease 1